MKIESIKIKNFRALKDVELTNIPSFCIFIGANGTGKSTLFQVFGFLKEAMRSNVTVALAKFGGSKGFEEVRSRNSEGDIEFEIKFRPTPRSPKATYQLHIGQHNGKVTINREVLKYRQGKKGQPWHFLNFTKGKGYYVVNNELEGITDINDLKREDQVLKSPDILAIKGFSQFEKFPAAVSLGNLIENWHVSDIHISSASSEQETGYAEHLSTEGENLSLVTEFLYNQHPEIFKKILQKLTDCVPGISKVEAKTTEEGKVLLKFQDGAFEDPFLAKYVSDGTIKMFAYLLLLFDPSPHPLLCIEEPENQLYQSLLHELAEEFRDYANRGGQVFVSTHSPDFLNAASIDEVFWLIKKDGYTSVIRANGNQQIKDYMDAGDQMGYLWKQGFFDGVSP
ncbi:MAG: AAA family ATPase [SAR324 cluster bacterium]|nr:AAA family ATPase [SAR324 cluster bacterium]